MTILSSIRDFVVRYKRVILHYGIAFLLMASALGQGKMVAAGVVFFITALMLAYDQWGKTFDEQGKLVFAQRKVIHEARMRELVAALWTRLGKKKLQAPPPPPSAPTGNSRLLQEAGLPPVESPPSVPLDSEPAKPQTPEVSVTHPT